MSNKLRIWRLGNLEHKILPTETIINKLADMIRAWDQESDLNIIWTPDLEVQQIDLDTNAVDIIVPANCDVKVVKEVHPKIRIVKEVEQGS